MIGICSFSLHYFTFFIKLFRLLVSDYERIANDAMHVTRGIRNEQNVLIIQPYIKWGPKRSDVPADVKLLEAEDLIRSLDTWKIQQSIKVGLISFNKATIFGSGKLEELQLLVKKSMANPDTKVSKGYF